MKPTKNRYYCPGAGKDKIHFQSFKAAERFLHYNAEAATDGHGRKPCRVYYCNYCDSYHVTSQIVGRHKDSFLRVYGHEIGSFVYESFYSLTHGKHQAEPILKKNIKELKRLLRFDRIDYDRCEDIIEEIINLFEFCFQYGLGDRMIIHHLFERFSLLCNRFKEYQNVA